MSGYPTHQTTAHRMGEFANVKMRLAVGITSHNHPSEFQHRPFPRNKHEKERPKRRTRARARTQAGRQAASESLVRALPGGFERA